MRNEPRSRMRKPFSGFEHRCAANAHAAQRPHQRHPTQLPPPGAAGRCLDVAVDESWVQGDVGDFHVSDQVAVQLRALLHHQAADLGPGLL